MNFEAIRGQRNQYSAAATKSSSLPLSIPLESSLAGSHHKTYLGMSIGTSCNIHDKVSMKRSSSSNLSACPAPPPSPLPTSLPPLSPTPPSDFNAAQFISEVRRLVSIAKEPKDIDNLLQFFESKQQTSFSPSTSFINLSSSSSSMKTPHPVELYDLIDLYKMLALKRSISNADSYAKRGSFSDAILIYTDVLCTVNSTAEENCMFKFIMLLGIQARYNRGLCLKLMKSFEEATFDLLLVKKDMLKYQRQLTLKSSQISLCDNHGNGRDNEGLHKVDLILENMFNKTRTQHQQNVKGLVDRLIAEQVTMLAIQQHQQQQQKQQQGEDEQAMEEQQYRQNVAQQQQQERTQKQKQLLQRQALISQESRDEEASKQHLQRQPPLPLQHELQQQRQQNSSSNPNSNPNISLSINSGSYFSKRGIADLGSHPSSSWKVPGRRTTGAIAEQIVYTYPTREEDFLGNCEPFRYRDSEVASSTSSTSSISSSTSSADTTINSVTSESNIIIASNNNNDEFIYKSNNTDLTSEVFPQSQVRLKNAEMAVSHPQHVVNFSSSTVPLNVVDLEKSSSNTSRRVGDINETSRRIRQLLANSSYYKQSNPNSKSKTNAVTTITPTKKGANTNTTTSEATVANATSRARARSGSNANVVTNDHVEQSKFDINYDLDGNCKIRMEL